uniref:Uncharacterized protein n=1 Tax=Onchocerca flexuosa TaxID=387005 RepID=A0A183HXS2_9BILA
LQILSNHFATNSKLQPRQEQQSITPQQSIQYTPQERQNDFYTESKSKESNCRASDTSINEENATKIPPIPPPHWDSNLHGQQQYRQHQQHDPIEEREQKDKYVFFLYQIYQKYWKK